MYNNILIINLDNNNISNILKEYINENKSDNAI